MNIVRLSVAGLLAWVAVISATGASATPLVFNGASATFQQLADGTNPGGWTALESIDGFTGTSNGWAIYDYANPDHTSSQTAYFNLSSTLAGGPTDVTFTMIQNYDYSPHTLGDFNFGYTTAAGADAFSAQTALTITGMSALGGATLNLVGGEIIAGGANPLTNIYTITAHVNAPVTGFFLNVFESGTNGQPDDGPGRASNGNFVLTELQASSVAEGVPEPASWALMLMGFGGLGAKLRRARRRPAFATL